MRLSRLTNALLARCCGLVLLLGFLVACQPSSDQPKPGERRDDPEQQLPDSPATHELLSSGIGMSDLPEQFASLWRPWSGDLDGMVERRAIRVLVVHSGYLYFFDEGRPRGITVEMLAEFERFLNKKYKSTRLPIHVVPIPVTRERLLPDLLAGRADLVAANLTVTPERSAQIDFSKPIYGGISEVIVTGPSAPPLESIQDLAGQDIFVRASSSYFENLNRLSAGFIAMNLKPPRIRLVEEVLEDLVMREDLVVNMDGDIAWGFRKGSPKLTALLNEFMRRHGQGTLYGNVVRNKYLDDSDWVKSVSSKAALEQLEPLSLLFKKYAEQYGFDWLELAAQAFQESAFDNTKKSGAGAVGIMQVKPSTAGDKNVAVENVHELENNIHAGAKYLRFLADRYFDDASMHPLDQWMFAVAAYNAGPAKIARMRRLAKKQGYDNTVWFDNVEVVVAKNIGRETVQYVSNIYKYYVAYKLSWERSDLREQIVGDR